MWCIINWFCAWKTVNIRNKQEYTHKTIESKKCEKKLSQIYFLSLKCMIICLFMHCGHCRFAKLLIPNSFTSILLTCFRHFDYAFRIEILFFSSKRKQFFTCCICFFLNFCDRKRKSSHFDFNFSCKTESVDSED